MIFLILLIGFILRLINLNQSFWLDEAITALAVKNYALLDLVTKFSPGDFHPPFYYLFLKLWSNVFGYSEISLRFPSVIFGVLTAYVVYLIGKKLFNAKVGLIAAILMATNPLAVYYSQEARMYSMAMFLVSASVLFLLHKKHLLFVLSLAIALYSDYMPVLMLPVFFMFSSTTIFACLFLLPWIPFLFGQLRAGTLVSNSWGDLLGRTNLKNLLLVPVKFIFGRISFDNKLFYAGITVPTLVAYFSPLLKVKSKLLWAWFLIPLFLGALISFKMPLFSYFRFLFVLPAFILLLACGLKNKWQIIFVLIVSLVSLTYFNLYPSFQREDWRGFVNFVEAKPGYILIPNLAQSAPIIYYDNSLDVSDSSRIRLDGKRTVYLLRYVQEIFDPQDMLKLELDNNKFTKIGEQQYNGLTVWIFSK